MVENLYIY